MKYPRRLEIFERIRAEYTGFLTAVLWKLTGDNELFAEAMQYSLLSMWRHIEKLNGKKAAAYIYRIALTANSKAWRNRIGRVGQISQTEPGSAKKPLEAATDSELAQNLRQAIAQLPPRQSKAIVMRYFQQQSYETIARNLLCSQAGARSHVSKALAALKTKLKPLAKGGQ